MEIKEQPLLKFYRVDFVRVNFVSKKKLINNKPIKVDISPAYVRDKNDPLKFNIIIQTRVSVHGYFKLEVTAVGYFQLHHEQSSIHIDLIQKNAPAIMFPYVRSFITTLTSNLGDVTGALVLPTQSFQGNIPELNP